MHRPALAVAGAGSLAVDFRHHPFHLYALGDAVAVTAVIARDVIITAQIHADPGRRGFLARVQVDETGIAAFGEFDVYAIFEFADGFLVRSVEQVLGTKLCRDLPE